MQSLHQTLLLCIKSMVNSYKY
uniref:Uncharacterized protein n=1 Tax=Rhizophora mucronata TaxID=61149 RepID=A0A2P2NTN3_RHIMU